jgi:hypothetical protein
MRASNRFTLIASLLALTSCSKTEAPQSQTKSEISGSADLLPSSLGKGFDSLTQTLKGKCVTGSPVWAGSPDSEISYVHDLDFDSLLQTFSGGLNVGAKIALFEIKGAGDFASKNAADDFSSTVSLINNVTIKRKVLDELRIDEFMRPNVLSGATVSPEIRSLCGDEYVSTVVYGASLIVNAKFTFQSREDKRDFNSSAGISFASLGELGGKIGRLDQRIKNNSRVTISARQLGGDPEKLTAIVANEVVSCNLSNFEEKCLPMLTKLIEYAKDPVNGFSSGLVASPDAAAAETPKGWAQLRFITTPFEDEPIEGKFLISKESPAELSDEVRDARDSVFDLNRDSLRDYERASVMLRTYQLSDEQHSQLERLQSAIVSNKIELANLTKSCLRKPDQCVKELERFHKRSLKYDPETLDIKPAPIVEPVKVTKPVVEESKDPWDSFPSSSSSCESSDEDPFGLHC